MKITLLHYRYVPAIAGVELIMEQQARLLTEAGHEVTVLTGSIESAPGRNPRVRVVVIPELQHCPPPGEGMPDFDSSVNATSCALRPWLESADKVIVHNVLTMLFHLACTAALWRLAYELPVGRIINWVHDLAAMNPDYAVPDHAPWALLRQRHPAMRVVAISELRARQFLALTGTAVDAVIPNGLDPLGLLNLTPEVAQFAAAHQLLEMDAVLLQPARILRRKNIELGLRLVAELKNRGCRVRLLITGAPDEHNPASAGYHAELLVLRADLGLRKEVLCISEFFAVTKAHLVSLYGVSDVLWFPSKQEGFGLPVLEGALHRLLIFCADIPPMNTFPLPTAAFFDPATDPGKLADQLLEVLEKNSQFLQARRTVVRRFAWSAVWPLIQQIITAP